MPIMTVLLAVPVEGRVPRRRELVSILVLTAGVALCVADGSLHGGARAIAACLLATLANALMTVCSARLMRGRVSGLQLSYYIAPAAALALCPFVIAWEWQPFVAFYAAHRGPALLALSVSSALAVLYNVVHYEVIRQTSSVTVAVLGQVKICLIVACSLLFFAEY